MYFPLPLGLVFLLLLPSEARLLSSTSETVGTVVQGAHRVALKHSVKLARDLRLAFKGVLVTQPVIDSASGHRLYCTSSSGSSGSGNVSSGNGTNGGTSNTTKSGGAGSATKTTGSASSSTLSSTPLSTPSPVPSVAASPWKLVESHQGNNFFSGWNFFTGGDPTAGAVQFVDQTTGQSNNLLEINSAGNAVMRVETTPQVASVRKSIRITTQSNYNGGLFIMDSVHMPTGCAVWPAFWTNGPTWPATGEIDIIEGVNDYTNNQMTIHTNPGCTIPSTSSSALSISGNVIGGTNCAAVDTGNQGCGIRANSGATYGPGFNANGGGVYAMQWDTTGIAIFFFPRGSIPSDISAGAPQPSGWGTPQARWPATSCNPFQFFSMHSAIFDTTLCGGWAGSIWGDSGIPGQEQSCAARTGVSTCEAFVQNNGSAFADAYWEVASVKIYQT